MKVVFLVVGLFFSVRGFAEHCLSNGQFTDTPNGCKHKGLVWSKPSDALMSFAKADTYCANMPKIDGVKKAWRLPTSEEFKAITKDGAVDVLKGVDLGRLYWMGGKKRGTPALYFFPQDVLLADQSVEGEYGVICVEEIRHIKQISVGFQHACVLDHEGVKCWGSNYYGQTEVPMTSSELSAGDWNKATTKFHSLVNL
ncbi:MAG: hypothetical protein NTV34_20065 [Proteobacteria bacterium]|nr:hypothetical protein [Pseudomonadota bacterium]